MLRAFWEPEFRNLSCNLTLHLYQYQTSSRNPHGVATLCPSFWESGKFLWSSARFGNSMLLAMGALASQNEHFP